MTGAADSFSTGVRDADGRWPGPPRTWSYSSLREAAACPRRWMLSRASYPGQWDRRGYPPRPGIPSLTGDIVHGAVAALLSAIREHGCSSSADPATVTVLKGLGGYTGLVERGIETELAKLADNPRAEDRTGALRTALRVRVPEIRQRVQAIIARTTVSMSGDEPGDVSPAGRRGALPEGAYPEVELRVPGLRLAGRADLLRVTGDGCEITDYKTGVAHEHHADQLRLYALLWSRDTVLNPKSLPARRLILSYPSHDADVPAPAPGDLDDLATATARQIEAADAAVGQRPPPARPAAGTCGQCDVRQLCDEYWNWLPHRLDDQGRQQQGWLDFEGIVRSQNGPRSWLLATAGDSTQLLLRTSAEAVPFKAGDRVRVLSLRHDADPESPIPVGTMTHLSEVFVMNAPG